MNRRARRGLVVGLLALGVAAWLVFNPANYTPEVVEAESAEIDGVRATEVLSRLRVAEWGDHDGYDRSEFGSGWAQIDGCDARNVILARDLTDVIFDGCLVMSGKLADPYSGKTIGFRRGSGSSNAVQIDHVVALSNAWMTGAQGLDKAERKELANDPLNLLAVDGPTNMTKSDKDAASWLPPNQGFRCQYVARQISVKYKYVLWVTEQEKGAMGKVLERCPNEMALGVED